MVSPALTKVGFIGTGVMGSSMARNIALAGYELHIYSRTKSKANELIEQGMLWHDHYRELAEQCDVVITIVGYPSDVEAIYFGEGGLISSAKQGAILIDMTTSSPALAVRIYEEAKARDVYALDAPVSGGDIGARNAALSIMVGGVVTHFKQRCLFLSRWVKESCYRVDLGLVNIQRWQIRSQ